MSTAFHALCDGGPDGKKKLALLSEEEREKIEQWYKPTPLDALGFSLEYAAAQTEIEVGLSPDGNFCTDAEKAMTIGHCDMYWVVQVDLGDGTLVKCVVVGDIKKTRWTTPDGPASLQVLAYGYALAQMVGADAFVPALWLAEEGEWVVGKTVGMFDLGTAELWELIRYAATNDSAEFSSGPHCKECWSRLNCPKWMVRYDDSLAVPGTVDGDLTPASALGLLLGAKQMEETAKAAKEYLQAWVDRNGPVPDGNGKHWAPVSTKGRESGMTPKELRERMGEAAKHYIKRGKPGTQYRWVKA
jgi:hypothetical protein